MRYFGGKARIAKPLAEFINSTLLPDQPFVDLFCGSCNVISKIDDKRVRIANDLHSYLIEMWKAVQAGQELPDEISEVTYNAVNKDKAAHPAWLVAFVGFGSSFAGKYFGGFARCDKGTNYGSIAKRSTLKKMQHLRRVAFTNNSYDKVVLPRASTVYCDIPYKNTTKYSTGTFNHDSFYAWAKATQAQGHTVLVSEYEHNVPEGWRVVWRLESAKSIRNKAGVQEATVEVIMTPN